MTQRWDWRGTFTLCTISGKLTLIRAEEPLKGIVATGMDGVIASNTTLSRVGISHPLASERVVLSGLPLREMNLRMLKSIVTKMNG